MGLARNWLSSSLVCQLLFLPAARGGGLFRSWVGVRARGWGPGAGSGRASGIVGPGESVMRFLFRRVLDADVRPWVVAGSSREPALVS